MTIRPLLALALALAAVAACGEEADTTIDAAAIDGRTVDAGPDAPIDAPPDANTFTTFVLDQIQNQTTATGTPVPYATFATLPDPDTENPAAYAPLFP